MIYLIRHGQASFLKSDYDQLSELGMKQSSVLGKALSTRKTKPTLVVGGMLKRHDETATHCLEAYGSNIGLEKIEAWNEYDHMELIAKHRPDLAGFEVLAQFVSSQENPMKSLQLLLNASIQDWMADKHEYTQTWESFKNGVWESLQSLAGRLEKEQNAWVFTSGGPISVAMIKLLSLDESKFVELQGRLVNTSITKVQVGRRGLSLSTYNDYSHLESEENMITYR